MQTPRVLLTIVLPLAVACTPGSTESATTSTQATQTATTENAGETSQATTVTTAGMPTADPSTETSETTETSTGGPSETGESSSASETSETTDSTSTDPTETTDTDTDTGDPPTETGNEGMGLGEIDGDCGLIDAMEIESPDPFLFTNSIDFGQLGFDYDALTPGGQEVYDDGNLGGNSLYSEVVSYEILARCDLAQLLKTEAEIDYQDDMGKKTDLLVALDGHTVGVSVTRAYGFPPEDPYTVLQAESLLADKLADIQLSSANVSPEDAWTKQILHVIAYEPMHVESVATAYAGLSDALKADTIVLVSVTHGDDLFVYE